MIRQKSRASLCYDADDFSYKSLGDSKGFYGIEEPYPHLHEGEDPPHPYVMNHNSTTYAKTST